MLPTGVRQILIVAACVAFVFGAAFTGGCSTETRYHMMSSIFQGYPKPGEEIKPKPVVHLPRRSASPLPVHKVVVTFVKPPPEPDWAAILQKLPKDAAGAPDWDAALEGGQIHPRPGIDSKAADLPVFDLTFELVPEGQPLFKVTFPHKKHTEWLTCTNCHTAIFKMQRGGDPITMAKIFAGEYCGRCHGKVAFAPATGCPRCHLSLAAPGGAK